MSQRAVIVETEHVRVLTDDEEPWRCYVEVWDDATQTWQWAGNPRLASMAEFGHALVGAFIAHARGA